MIVDSHAHLDDQRFDEDREQIIKAIKAANIDRVINIGSSLKSSEASVELSEKYDFIYAACGIHPHEASSFNKELKEQLYLLLKKKKVVAIGEIGLDFHYDFSPRDVQIKVFIEQIKMANELQLPIIIHDREAHRPTLDALIEYKDKNIEGVFHSYSGSAEMINEVLALNFYLSFNGIATFKNAKKIHEAIKAAPLEKILIETDSPYLTPEPFRGKRNDSSKVIYVAKAIAAIKGVSEKMVYEATWENTNRLFKF